MSASLRDIFSSEFFLPHGHCYLWTPRLLWLEVLSNGFIALAYFAIAATLAYTIYRNRDIPFKAVVVAFVAFTITGGLTHLFDICVIWNPVYWLDGGVRGITALVSIATAIALPALIPKAVALARGARDGQRDLQTALESTRVAREQAERASQSKTQFLGLVSHELRTPLTALQLQLERLRRTRDGALSAQQHQIVERIDRSSQRLLDLIESLLTYAAIQSGRVVTEVRAIDLNKTVADVVDELRPAAEEKHIALRWSPSGTLPPLNSDPQLIKLVLVNLVSNGIKFTQEGEVEVSVSYLNAEHRLAVRDTGPGISASDRLRIFHPFEQLEPVTAKHTPGVGLGLALVQEMVRSLHGRIDLASEVGLGSTFVVTVASMEKIPDQDA